MVPDINPANQAPWVQTGHALSWGVTINQKYGSPRYEAGDLVHGPFLVITVQVGSPKKNSSKDKIKKKNSRETA